MREEKVIAFDGYNFCVGGGTASTMRASRADEQHIPCIVIIRDEDELSESDRKPDGE